MSNPSTEQTAERRFDPVTASEEVLLSHFATDPERGLRGREADRRRDRSGALPLFATTARTFPRCLRATLREPILWIMLALSVIALCFDRMEMGFVCLALTVAHTLLCAYLLFCAERVDGTMQRAYDAPSPRVLRSGRVCRVGAEAVVPGDILLIYPGDLIPADCRLLRTEHFAVRERALDAGDPDRPSVCLDKDATHVPTSAEDPRFSPPNMAYAGAIAETGYAVALVVAVGTDTHVGALLGKIRPAHGIRRPTAQKITEKIATISSLIMAVLIIPLVVLGILTLRDKHEFFDICLSCLSLAALGLCEHTVAKFVHLAASVRRDAATARDAVNTADIRAAVDTEHLCGMTDLILLGTAALHDGVAHPVGLCTGGQSYRCDLPEADDEARAAVELLFLWQYGRTHLPLAATAAASAGIGRTEAAMRDIVPLLCDWADVDIDALLVKYQDIYTEGDGVSAVMSTEEGSRRITVTVCADADRLCGMNADYESARAEAEDEGVSSLYLALRTIDGEHIRALLTYAARVSPKTAGWIKGMEAAGIRVAALLPQDVAAYTPILSACGLCDRYPIDRPTPDRVISARIGGGIRAFVGCSDREIADCIRDLKAEGRVVGVLSVDAKDTPHLNAADIAFTCAPSLYADAASDFLRPIEDGTTATADGLPNAPRATALSLRRADVVVRRASPEGGGVGGVRMALLAADRTKAAFSVASAYLFLANVLRLLSVLLSLAFGLLPIPAPILMLSGWGVDTLVLYCCSRMSGDTTVSPRSDMSAGLDRTWYTYRAEWICLCATASLPWLIAWVARLSAADIGTGLSGYAWLCILALQISLYLSLRPRRKDRTSAMATLGLCMVYIASLAASLGIGLHPLYAILVPPVPALLYIAAAALVRRFSGRSA